MSSWVEEVPNTSNMPRQVCLTSTKHVKHAQTGMFNMFEGVCRVGEEPNTKTCPPRCVFMFKGCGGT